MVYFDFLSLFQLVNNPIEIFSWIEHMRYQVPLALSLCLRDVVLKSLVATTYSDHSYISPHFTIASMWPYQEEISLEIDDWNSNMQEFNHSSKLYIDLLILTWYEFEWREFENVVTGILYLGLKLIFLVHFINTSKSKCLHKCRVIKVVDITWLVHWNCTDIIDSIIELISLIAIW